MYRADQTTDGVFELYSVPIDGAVLDDFLISADSSSVVYRADQTTDGVFELYSVSIGGSIATRLSGDVNMNSFSECSLNGLI